MEINIPEMFGNHLPYSGIEKTPRTDGSSHRRRERCPSHGWWESNAAHRPGVSVRRPATPGARPSVPGVRPPSVLQTRTSSRAPRSCRGGAL